MYKSIYTETGLSIISQVIAQGSQIRLTHMAVGDGNGSEVEPKSNQVQLVRERFRTTVNRIFQDPENENLFTAELIIPVSVGGFVMREIGLFDSNGNLIIVGNIPNTYKPVDAGIFEDTVFRISFVVSNAEIVELKIDPNVVIATHSWILNTITPATIFPGGTTGQILKKKSNIDGDTEWGDASTVDIHVDNIEEVQTLAASQTVVTLSTVTTQGLAVYIDGKRIPNNTSADGWQAISATEIALGKSYSAGMLIQLVQNEPLGTAPYPLAQSKNLSDVANKVTARNNLDVYSKSESRANGLPAGSVIAFANSSAPSGYLKANGANISRTVYADLFAAIGTLYGVGDGVNTFQLPDLRGEFIRGWDDGRGIDSDRLFGSKQVDEFRAHTHELNTNGVAAGVVGTTQGGLHAGSGKISSGTTAIGGTETRPRNVALLYCIKY